MIRFRYVTAHGVAGFLIGLVIPFAASVVSNRPIATADAVVYGIAAAVVCAVIGAAMAAIANAIATPRFRDVLTFLLLLATLFAIARFADRTRAAGPELAAAFPASVSIVMLAATMRRPRQDNDRGI